MTPDKKRGIGAVLIAFGVIGILLWLAVARLSLETALRGGGIVVGAAALGALWLGAILLRASKG